MLNQSPATIAMLLVASTAWAAVETRQSRRTRPGAVATPESVGWLPTCLPFVGLVAGAVISWTVPATAIHPGWLVPVIGLAALCCGTVLRLWCFRTLGGYFTFRLMTSGDQSVITSGPYRFVRHPSYTGMTLAFTGMAAFAANWLSLAVVALSAVALFVPSIRIEERMLHRELGDAYAGYAGATRHRLVPLVW